MQLQVFLRDLKSVLLLNYKQIIISLVIAFFSFPRYHMDYSPGGDGSLPWVFNYFANGHFSLGRHTLFPHGPLAFFLYPLPVRNNLIVCSVVTFICSFLLSMNLFRIYKLLKPENLVLVTLISLLLHSVMEIQLLLIGLVLSQLLLFHLTNRKIYLGLALFFCVFNLFIKTYGGVISILLVAGESLYLITVRKNFKLAAFNLVGLIFFFLGFWLCLYCTFDGALTFLRGQLELSSDNSEAVGLYAPMNWWLIGICWLGLLLIPFTSGNTLIRHISLLMLLPFFAAWKHAMARADEAHVPGFLNVLLFFSLFIWLIQPENRLRTLLLCLIPIGAFMLNMTGSNYSEQKIALFKPGNLYRVMTDYDKLCDEKNAESNFRISSKVLPDTLLKLIGKHTVDIYPWNYSIIAANHFNWIPRPVIDSYAAYTSWLDAQDAQHIRSTEAPQFMIWEISRGVFERLDNLLSIDSRYLMNDEPVYIIDFFSNYAFRYKNKDYVVFEKRKTPLNYITTHFAPEKKKLNAWTKLPEFSPGCVGRAKLKIKKSFLGVLKSALYKGEGFFLEYELENGKFGQLRIVPKNAEQGIWLSPFMVNPATNQKEPRIKRFKIRCLDEKMIEPYYTLSFDRFDFKVPDLQDYFFGKNEEPVKGSLPDIQRTFHFNSSKIDSVPVDAPWMESDELTHIPAAGKTGQIAYSLKPGGYSGHYSFLIDKSDLPEKYHYIKVTVSAFIKAISHSQSLFVISQTQPPPKALWLSQNLGDLITLEGAWNRVSFSQKIDIKDIREDESLNILFWNRDQYQDLYFDEILVTLQPIP